MPVIKAADKMDVFAVAKALAELSGKARDGKLPGADMQGAGFTITSLGGIGGTLFTPIINSPEVAILGVSKSAMKPVWDGKEFAPRLMLPLSFSYDHRVIDGAMGARIAKFLAETLAKPAGSARGHVVSKIDLTVPDLGNFDEVAIVDVLVKVGDKIEVDTPLVTLETDKATMDVPSTAAGTVTEVLVQKGGKIAKGGLIARIEGEVAAAKPAPRRAKPRPPRLRRPRRLPAPQLPRSAAPRRAAAGCRNPRGR